MSFTIFYFKKYPHDHCDKKNNRGKNDHQGLDLFALGFDSDFCKAKYYNFKKHF